MTAQILDENGRMCNTYEDIASTFVHYYLHLITTDEANNIGGCIHVIERKVSSEMNLQLLSKFIVEEIGHALNQMQPMKAPGPDSFAACFYQQKWAMVGEEVCKAILSFLNFGQLDAQINVTNITLGKGILCLLIFSSCALRH